jgi:hypothetical protein
LIIGIDYWGLGKPMRAQPVAGREKNAGSGKLQVAKGKGWQDANRALKQRSNCYQTDASAACGVRFRTMKLPLTEQRKDGQRKV